MSILYLLIGLALLLMGVAVALFAWTVSNSQYEDLDGPAYRILLDDDDVRIPASRVGGGGGRASSIGNELEAEAPRASPDSRSARNGMARQVLTESGREDSSAIV